MDNSRVFAMSFASIYPLYIQKVTRKGRTQAELNQVLFWLTGYNTNTLKKVIDDKVDLKTFFAKAPKLNPKAKLITGMICGYRIEDIKDPLMQKIRYMDKLVDELAKGRAMKKILMSEK